MLKVVKAGYHGILLPEVGIGLDYSGTKAEHIFISHAHADHMPRNRKLSVYATPPTASFMKLRGFGGEVKPLEFGHTLETDKAQITFYPAGHILGSAMTFVESDFGNLLYTGDYRTPPSPATEGFELPDAEIDTFITEATFSLPIYKWKTEKELALQIRNFASQNLEEGFTPILTAYNLGKAQELMFILKKLNHPMQIHGAGFKLCKVYEEHGFPLGEYDTYNRETCEGKILISPSSALGTGFASNVKKKRIAYCSGWAANESRQTQLTVDELIPISDHLDFFELIDLCKTLNPKKVLITHTPNPKVVQHYLDGLGINSGFLDLEGDGK
jgi:putative mRNA 3-end processing factor